ncbi:MAG TPA: KH domain-containing protein [Candidatus Dormibacteraeota bacterium]|nr:KH domain-containing protein [Candidatus Dormibacteraeota bacterium]
MADLREQFIDYVVKSLVATPEAVRIERKQDDKGEFIELTVDAADMGKVIGKAGATAKSIRTLLRVVGAKDDLPPLPLKIVEPDGTTDAVVPADEAEEVQEIAEPKLEDDHRDLHEQTKREAQELADLEL